MPRTYRVLLLESIHPVARKALVDAGFAVELFDGSFEGSDLRRKLEGVDALGIRSSTQITPEVLEVCGDLLAIGAFCIGTNQIDLEAATKAGVAVFNAPFSNTRSVAELVVSEVISLSRKIGDRAREMHGGVWRKSADGSHEVRGKTLGIVGYGHIGRQVGVLAEALGMRVLFFDLVSQLPMGNNRPCTSLSELLSKADFVTLHVPATAQTENMIGRDQFCRMKEGSYLLNLSRGSVVDIPALAEALRGGRLAGAAIDVFPQEPKSNAADDFESELRGLSNVIMTPHIGGSTIEAQENIGREVSAALTKYLERGSTAGSVNFPVAELPWSEGRHRIANVHRNVPGVLRDLNRLVSETGANVQAQLLSTSSEVGYLIVDLDTAVSEPLVQKMRALPETIRARVL